MLLFDAWVDSFDCHSADMGQVEPPLQGVRWGR